MECKFVVNQRVVCIESFRFQKGDEPHWLDGRMPKEGDIFTIINIEIEDDKNKDDAFLYFNEIEYGWIHYKFAALETKPTEISIFTKMLNNQSMPKELENAI